MQDAPRNGPVIFWVGLDLRLSSNPALQRALAEPRAVLPVFIWAPEEEAPWAPGAASRWWLNHSLTALEAALAERGSRLIVRRGPGADALISLAEESGARSVVWNRRYEPAVLARDRELQRRLRQAGIGAESCPGNLLLEPGSILNNSGKPYQVFSAFWRACHARLHQPKPVPAPDHIPMPTKWPSSVAISSLGLEPKIDWSSGMREVWRPGEQDASRRLSEFAGAAIETYSSERDRPDHHGTSRLSPHLHFGEISAGEIWHRVHGAVRSPDREEFLRQLAWREFSYHLLFHFPHTAQEPLRPEFGRFPWRVDSRALRAWTKGKTGYPLVDAGMRELWHTGWMHNRVRMLAASFLVKHLLIPWQEGAAWFWDTLVDADLANNTMGWQWTAGCGADAAPYFRIFNPATQAGKFDPDGEYVRRWVPEVGLKAYPRPIVDHAMARQRALDALAEMRQGSK